MSTDVKQNKKRKNIYIKNMSSNLHIYLLEDIFSINVALNTFWQDNTSKNFLQQLCFVTK